MDWFELEIEASFQVILLQNKCVYISPCHRNYFFQNFSDSPKLLNAWILVALEWVSVFLVITTCNSISLNPAFDTNSFGEMNFQPQNSKTFLKKKHNYHCRLYSIYKKPINKPTLESLKLTFFFCFGVFLESLLLYPAV